MRLLVILVGLFISGSSIAEDVSRELSWAEWSLPKSAQSVLSMPALQEVMTQLQSRPQSRLYVYYPGGDEGNLWAVEVRAWLVSLGLAGQRIHLMPGSQFRDRLRLEVIDKGQYRSLSVD